jgi:uncharacterized protein (TIGR03067 family)
VRLTIEGDAFTFRHLFSRKTGGSFSKGRIEIDPTKTPKTMDQIPAQKTIEVPTNFSLYELEGDRLRICPGYPGAGRPTEFTAREGSRQEIVTYRRVKDVAALEAGDIEREFKLLQGTWQLVSVEQEGRQVELPEGKQVRLTIRGHAFDYLMGFGVSGKLSIDPTKMPKTLSSALIKKTGDLPDVFRFYEFPCIYEVNGDELWISARHPKFGRPTEFTSREGSGQILFTFRREKPKP